MARMTTRAKLTGMRRKLHNGIGVSTGVDTDAVICRSIITDGPNHLLHRYVELHFTVAEFADFANKQLSSDTVSKLAAALTAAVEKPDINRLMAEKLREGK